MIRPFFCANFARILRKISIFFMEPVKQLDWRKKNETIVNMVANVFNHELFWKKLEKHQVLMYSFSKTLNFFVFPNFVSIITMTWPIVGKKNKRGLICLFAPQKKYFFSVLEISHICGQGYGYGKKDLLWGLINSKKGNCVVFSLWQEALRIVS